MEREQVITKIKQLRVAINEGLLLNKDTLNVRLVETYRSYATISQELQHAYQELRKAGWQLGYFLKEYGDTSPYQAEHKDAASIVPRADNAVMTIEELQNVIVKQDITWNKSELVHKIDFLRLGLQNLIDEINVLISNKTINMPVNRAVLAIRHLEYTRWYYGEVIGLIRDEYNRRLND
jgi:hypothetical protein